VSRLTARPLRRSLDQIRYVTPVRPAAARDLIASVYAQSERDFGMIAPPVALHSPAPGPLAACWIMLRETLLAPPAGDRAARETVAAAVSLGNTCPYCVAVHGAAMGGLAGGPEAAAIASGSVEAITSTQLREIAAWALNTGELAAPGGPPFPAAELPRLAGVALTFHYLNRMVNVFLEDSPLPPATPGVVGRGLMRVLARIMLSAGRGAAPPGASVSLLPAAPLPADLAWAAGLPHVAGALSRATAAIEDAAARAVPASVRELVLCQLAGWDATAPGPGRGWVADAVSGVPPADRPAATLALLTALASYQVLPADIGSFQRHQPGDEALIAVTSWASLAAARRAASWLVTDPPTRATA
jgi:AhpD family alkylhydroperoxidase